MGGRRPVSHGPLEAEEVIGRRPGRGLSRFAIAIAHLGTGRVGPEASGRHAAESAADLSSLRLPIDGLCGQSRCPIGNRVSRRTRRARSGKVGFPPANPLGRSEMRHHTPKLIGKESYREDLDEDIVAFRLAVNAVKAAIGG